ncbi:MAG: polysaccharide deacetylase family protein [Candidatus Heimdallarchaeaceae archaeon]
MYFPEKIPVCFVLHAYQPITQEEKILERIVKNCYLPFFQQLIENPEVSITLNITGCLIEKLATKYPDILQLIEIAISDGQIELTGSAFYHPLLPLLSIDNQKYQIGKQKEIIDHVFGKKTKVFFPPELALSENIIPQVAEKGYKIILAPETLVSDRIGGYYILENNKTVFLLKRIKDLSNNIAFNLYKEDLSKAVTEIRKRYREYQVPLVFAMDLETFGEHQEKYYEFFFKLNEHLNTTTVEQLVKEYKYENIITEISSSSWSTSIEDQKKGIPFPLWNHPNNAIHQLQHTHLDILDQVKNFLLNGKWVDDYQAAHYSCQFWWASKDWYGPELILEGLRFQRKVLNEMIEELSDDTKQIIFNLSNDIIKKVVDIIAFKEDQNEHSIHYS